MLALEGGEFGVELVEAGVQCDLLWVGFAVFKILEFSAVEVDGFLCFFEDGEGAFGFIERGNLREGFFLVDDFHEPGGDFGVKAGDGGFEVRESAVGEGFLLGLEVLDACVDGVLECADQVGLFLRGGLFAGDGGFDG